MLYPAELRAHGAEVVCNEARRPPAHLTDERKEVGVGMQARAPGGCRGSVADM